MLAHVFGNARRVGNVWAYRHACSQGACKRNKGGFLQVFHDRGQRGYVGAASVPGCLGLEDMRSEACRSLNGVSPGFCLAPAGCRPPGIAPGCRVLARRLPAWVTVGPGCRLDNGLGGCPPGCRVLGVGEWRVARPVYAAWVSRSPAGLRRLGVELPAWVSPAQVAWVSRAEQ